jgi:hypothetical protein
MNGRLLLYGRELLRSVCSDTPHSHFKAWHSTLHLDIIGLSTACFPAENTGAYRLS